MQPACLQHMQTQSLKCCMAAACDLHLRPHKPAEGSHVGRLKAAGACIEPALPPHSDNPKPVRVQTC